MTDFFTPANVIVSGFQTSGTDIVQIDTTKRLLINLSSSDQTGACLVTKKNFSVVDAAINANIISLGVQTGSFTYISSEKTGTASYVPLAFFTSGSEKMQIDTSGNLLVNTTQLVSGSKVVVKTNFSVIYGDTNSVVFTSGASATNDFTFIGSTHIGSTPDCEFRIYIGAVQATTILPTSGNVGIATAVPTQKLHVTGNILSTGALQASSVAISGSPANSFIGTGIAATTTFKNNAGSTFKISLGTSTAASDNYIGLTDSTDLGILVNNTVTHVIFKTGNIRIGGTTDNGYKLEVSSGDVKIGGGITFSDSLVMLSMSVQATLAPTLIGTAGGTINASAVLQADSTTKGFLPPRMTTAQRNAISSPLAGLTVYNTTTNKLNLYTTTWEAITSA